MEPQSLTLSIPQFCEQANISKSHFYVLQERNEGPPTIRLGGRVLIVRQTAIEWLIGLQGVELVAKKRSAAKASAEPVASSSLSASEPMPAPPVLDGWPRKTAPVFKPLGGLRKRLV